MQGEYADFHVDGYDIEGLLGAGPTGELWLARHTSSGSLVGLKRLRPKDVDAHDEARRIVAILGMLNHPSLLRIREMLPYGNDELVLVQDHAEGGTLDQLLFARTNLDPGEMVTIGATMAHALAAAHDHGLVHGDVTPESIVFTAEGQPLLTDVGLSALVEHWDVLGTHGYADPAAPDTPTAASDVYGLAAVCYTALAGTPLDPGQPRRALHQVAPGVPPGLSHAIEAGLQADPQQRPDAASFAGQLDGAAPRSAVRFPDAPDGGVLGGVPGQGSGSGGSGDGGSSSGGSGVPGQGAGSSTVEGNPFAIGDQSGAAGSGGAGSSAGTPGQPGAQPTPGPTPGLFAPGPAPATPFTPGASVATGEAAAAGTPGTAGTPGADEFHGDEDDEDDEDRPRRSITLPWRGVAIGAAAVVLVVVAVVIGLKVFGGGGTPEPTTSPTAAGTGGTRGPVTTDLSKVELSGPNARKWAGVFQQALVVRSKAWETLDSNKLGEAFVKNSQAWNGEASNMQLFKAKNFTGAIGLTTKMTSVAVSSATSQQVRLNVTAVLQPYQVKYADGSLLPSQDSAIGSTSTYQITLVHKGSQWLVSEWK